MKRCMGCMHEIDDGKVICPDCGYREGTLPSETYYLETGTVLANRYIVGKVLGYGGFGITYIGWDSQLKRIVAIKEYFPSELSTRGKSSRKVTGYSGEKTEQYQLGLEKFIFEAKRLAQFCKTDGIVHIYDCIRENGTGYIIMEYLQGKTIKELLREKGKYDYKEAEKIILDVLDDLKKVHEVGIIHRDIAPDNIFITDDGHVCLLDFGAARQAVSEFTRELSVILKPGYAPEEQYRSKGKQGTWTDVYGVGATFYKMITGIRPVESIERLMIRDEISRPSELGVSIDPMKEQALMKSIAVKKEERFQTVTEFKEALSEGIADPPHSWKKVIIAGTAVLCVIGAVGFAAWRYSGTNMPQAGGTALKMTEAPVESTEADSTDTPVLQDDGEIQNTEYKFNVVVNGKNTELTLTNKTKYSSDILQIISVHGTDEVLAEKTEQNCSVVDDMNLNENGKYMIRFTDQKTGKTLVYYNVDLSHVLTLSLYEWDDYTYVEYTVEGRDTPVDTKHYRTLTYASPVSLYALTGLSIRDLPSTETGTVKAKYAAGDEIQVYGTSVGLKGTEEIIWYLVKYDGGYGYISAEAGYTTNNKAAAQAKAEAEAKGKTVQNSQTTDRTATSQSVDTGSSDETDSDDANDESGESEPGVTTDPSGDDPTPDTEPDQDQEPDQNQVPDENTDTEPASDTDNSSQIDYY